MRVQLNNNHSSSEFMSRIFVVCVFMFSLQYALYLVSDILFDGLIKLSSFALLMLFALRPSNRINGEEVILLLFYCMLFASAAVPVMMGIEFSTGESLLKLFFMSLILPVLILCYRNLPKCDDFLISTFIAIGVLFSVQAIAASIGVFSGVLDKSQFTFLEKYGGMPSVDFGIFGLGNAIRSPALVDYSVLRPQGWFIEPSKLAAFLLLPAFISIGRYRAYRKKIYLLLSFVIFIAIFLTLSLAGYFAVACATLLLLFSKSFYSRLKRIPILKYFYVIPIFLIFFGFAYSLLNLMYLINDIDFNSATEGQAVLAGLLGRDEGGTSGNLFRETYKLDNYVNLLMNSPFGVGFGATAAAGSGLRSGNALVFWFTAGGIPAVLVVTMMYTYIFLVFCHPLLISRNAVFNALSASFIGHAVHNLSYGMWIEPYFMIHLALVVMSTRKAKLNVFKKKFG